MAATELLAGDEDVLNDEKRLKSDERFFLFDELEFRKQVAAAVLKLFCNRFMLLDNFFDLTPEMVA